MARIHAGLSAAIAVSFLYFGAQLAAAPFFPGYSFLTDSASLLGSDRSTLPLVLNTGAFLSGVAALAAAYGIAAALKQSGVRRIWIWLVALSLVSTGAAAIWASLFHLPDPRHNPGMIGAGMFAVPIVLLAALWSVSGARAIKVYLVINLVALGVLILVMAGLTTIDLSRYGGLCQRFIAAVIYVPIGMVGWFLLRRLKQNLNMTQPT